MKIVKGYFVQLALVVCVIIFILIAYNNQSSSVINDSIVNYNQNWNVEVNGNITWFNELSKEIKGRNIEKITLSKVLPDDIIEGDGIIFYTYHQSMEAFIDGVKVSSFVVPNGYKSKTPGNAWQCINLDKSYGGKTISIDIMPSYNGSSVDIPQFRYGPVGTIVLEVLKPNIFPVLSCVIIFFIGVVMILYMLVCYKKNHRIKYILWLGLFSVMLSIWASTDMPIFSLVLQDNILLNHIKFMSLKSILIPILLFVRHMCDYKKNVVLDALCVLSIIDFFASVILQLTGVLDFKETLIFTHIIFAFGAIWIIYLTLKNITKTVGKQQEIMKIHMGFLVIGSITVALDIINYYFIKSSDSSRFTRIGVIVYTLALICIFMNNSNKWLNSNEQVERIKEFAKRDATTKLNNRIAFEDEINDIAEDSYPNYGIAVFDLNDLKQFNDIYGHSMGDYYIIICSEIIQDIFGKYGEVYRIGGDEFCSIMKNVTEDEYVHLADKMRQRIGGLNNMSSFFTIKMSIASGFANFNPKQDRTLNNTVQRADQSMYENKSIMKKEQLKHKLKEEQLNNDNLKNASL